MSVYRGMVAKMLALRHWGPGFYVCGAGLNLDNNTVDWFSESGGFSQA